MILDVNKDNLELLAITACPIDFQETNSNDYCILIDNEVFYGRYNGSEMAACRACWLKFLFNESEDNYE